MTHRRVCYQLKVTDEMKDFVGLGMESEPGTGTSLRLHAAAGISSYLAPVCVYLLIIS